jgi:DNA modification methylase
LIEYLDGRVTLYPGDCMEVIKRLADNSIDAVCTDPPYALVSIGKRFSSDTAAPAQFGRDGAYARASAGFMGKKWDTGEVAFAIEFWMEVLRALKPGGHVIAFGGTRTYHRLAIAIEDAGFEIRDQKKFMHRNDLERDTFFASLTDEQQRQFIKLFAESDELGQLSWDYGSGFPKSHNVSKGIAKRRVEDIEPIRAVCRFIRAAMDDQGLKSKDLTQHFGDCDPRLIDHWAARDTDSQPSLPTPDQWQKLVEVLRFPCGDDEFQFINREVARLNDRKGLHGERWSGAEVIGEIDVASPGFGDLRFVGDRSIRELDHEAAQWEGWGTALKPAWEPIVLARKPLIGSVAENVLEHGTGALNIDGCRVPSDDSTRRSNAAEMGYHGGNLAASHQTGSDAGRFPANIIHDGSDEVVAAFPDTDSGGGPAAGTPRTKLNTYGDPTVSMTEPKGANSGSAARFFYTAKADAEDRLGSKHPTVKPLDLMQYLVRMVTPPGGTVLDPFAGTGTTGEAAYREGMRAILIEREEEYQADIARRMELAQNPTKRAAVAKSKNKLQGAEGTPLFGDA